MKNEALLRLNARDLICEIERTVGEGARGLVREIATTVVKELEGDLATTLERVRHLKEQRAAQHPRQSPEDARRRLQNPKLLTPYPVDVARALIAQRLELSAEVSKLIQQLFVPLTKLELIDAELDATREMLIELDKARELHRSTGLYSGSVDFLSRLNDKYNIDWKDLDALTEQDEREIADVVLRRYRDARKQPQ